MKWPDTRDVKLALGLGLAFTLAVCTVIGGIVLIGMVTGTVRVIRYLPETNACPALCDVRWPKP